MGATRADEEDIKLITKFFNYASVSREHDIVIEIKGIHDLDSSQVFNLVVCKVVSFYVSYFELIYKNCAIIIDE